MPETHSQSYARDAGVVFACAWLGFVTIEFLPVVGRAGLASWGLTYFHALGVLTLLSLGHYTHKFYKLAEQPAPRRSPVATFLLAGGVSALLVCSFPLLIATMLHRVERSELFVAYQAMENVPDNDPVRVCGSSPDVNANNLRRGCERLLNIHDVHASCPDVFAECLRVLSSVDARRIERHLEHFGNGGGPAVTWGSGLSAATLVTLRGAPSQILIRAFVAIILLVTVVLGMHIDRRFVEDIFGNFYIIVPFMALCVAATVLARRWHGRFDVLSGYVITLLAACTPAFVQLTLARQGLTASSAPLQVWLSPLVATATVITGLLWIRGTPSPTPPAVAGPARASPPVAAEPTREYVLHELICNLFTEAHLRRFLRLGEQGDAVVKALPGGISSFADLVDGAVAELVRRGLVASLWPRLRVEFPARADDIDSVASVWSSRGP